MTLMLHAGGEAIAYDALRTLPTPPNRRQATCPFHTTKSSTWSDMRSVSSAMKLLEEHHAVTPDGMNYFGVLSLRSPHGRLHRHGRV